MHRFCQHDLHFTSNEQNLLFVADSCVSATIDPRHNKPQYNSNENCSQQLHFICEAKQTDLYKEKEEEENEFLPQALKRHKYGHRDSAMEMSNLALSQQERSHRADEDDSIAHKQEQISRDIDDEVHARHKRALGEDYNGDDGQVLVDDTVAFQANIDLHLDSIPNSKLIQNSKILQSRDKSENDILKPILMKTWKPPKPKAVVDPGFLRRRHLWGV